MNVHRMVAGIALVLSLFLAESSVALAAEKASGTIVIDEVQVSVLLGGDFGGGTLVLHSGKSYSFKAKGVKVGGVGVSKFHLVGDVYHLKNVKDFPGIYLTAEVGLTVGKGKAGAWLKNDKGVYIHLRGNTEGLALSAGVEGVEITMD